MFDRVVVGATDAQSATRAVTRAIELTRVSGGTLHVVLPARRRRPMAVGEERRSSDVRVDAEEALLRRIREMAARESVPLQLYPLQSDPAGAITAVALEQCADLIVVGAGPERRSRQLSDVPKAVMDRADCAVMVV